MKPKHQRLIFLCFAFLMVALAVSLALVAPVMAFATAVSLVAPLAGRGGVLRVIARSPADA